MARERVLLVGPGFRAFLDDPFDDEGDMATCRGCGCTDWNACPGGCAWVEDPEGKGDLCSICLVTIWNGEPLPLDRTAG